MKIAFNPSTVAALTTPPNNKDITFDLRGRSIFARGVKFCGTDTNTWRDIKINNVSIGSNILDLRNGSNTTLTNTNGVVTINSTWRPVVDNLTSDSTTSSLSAKQGKVLKALLNSKLSVYELADNTNVGTIKNNGIYYSTTDASSGTLTNSPFNNGFALINMTSYNDDDDLRRSRLAFNAYGEIKVSDDRDQANTAETWYNVLTSKNSGINGSTIKLNGNSITVYSSGTADGRYVKKSGDTMQGVLTIDTTNFGALTIKRNDDAYGASIQFRGKSSVYGYIGLNNSTKDKQFLRWSSDSSRIYTILDTSSTYISNGKGVINGTTITQVDNATNSTNSTNARKLVNWYSARPTSLNAQFGDGSLRIFYATSSTTEGKPAEDSHILHLAWDNTGGWDAQLAVHTLSGKVSTRAQNAGTWQPWKTLAFITDIPTSLKNPYSFNVFGVVYDGSAAKTVTTSNFISQVNEGTSTITDGTMLITSYASNSGFADTNAVNVPYKRKAIHLWEYIKAKTDSLYATKGHNHDEKYLKLTGGWMSGDINFGGDNKIYWGRNTDSASISFKNDGDQDANSYMSFITSDNGNEYFRWSHSQGSTNIEWMALRSDGLRVRGTKVSLEGHTHNDLYYTESEVNSLLDAKLNRQNLSYGTWNPRGHHLAADYSYNGGDLSISENNGKMYVSVDGCFWQNEGQYRVLDTSDIGDIRLYQYLSATDAAWFPLVWGGASHNNTSTSTGPVYKSYDKLSWQTSSQTLYATNIQTNNIKNLSIGGGIYWNSYVKATTDNTDAASITLVRSGVAGGTTLVLSQMDNTNDTIQFKTNTAARLYHNNYPILTTQNTYVSNNKGYINGLEITQVNNADMVDGVHMRWTHNTKDTWIPVLSNGNLDYILKSELVGQYNSASATKLQTPRNIWGQSFDGTADVNGTIYINNSNSANGAIRLNSNINSNARISAIDSQVIFNTGNAIRFGETAWDWSKWAGLKYNHSNKTIYLGIADGSIFNANSAQSGGTLSLTSIDTLQFDVSEAHIGHDRGYSDPWGGLRANFKFGGVLAATHIYSNGGFHKNGSSDSYVLLGGGGHKLESSLNVAYSNLKGITLTGGDYNNTGYRLIFEKTMGGWDINYGVWAIAFRHSGRGTLNIGFDTTNSDGSTYTYNIRFLGSTASRESTPFRAFYNATTKIFRIYWHYYDYTFGDIAVLRGNMEPHNGTWITSLPNDVGTELAITCNMADQATNADTVDGYHATDGRTFDGDIHWGSWNDVWSDGTHTHPWYGFDHRYPNTGAYSTTISDYFGMTIKTYNTLLLDCGTLLLNSRNNVGIGTTSPTQKLDVVGNIRATGQLYLPTNGNYNAILMGDDCWMGDCNISNVIGLSGTNNANSGGIKFGKGGMYIGYNGSSHYSSGTSLWTNFNADTVDGEHASNFSYTHQSSFDFSKRKSGRIVTFDQSGTNYGWINGFASTHNNYLTSVIFNTHRTSDWYVGYMEGDMSTGETNGLQAVHRLAFADGDDSYPIFLGCLDLYHGGDGTISSSFYCLGYSVPFTYTRGGNYCKIIIPDTTRLSFYIIAATASVNYSGGGMDTWTGSHRGSGAWWLHCYAYGLNEVRVKGFCQADKYNDSWWGGNPLWNNEDGANKITVCIFGHVKYK